MSCPTDFFPRILLAPLFRGRLAKRARSSGHISQQQPGLVPNIDKGKLKTGMLIPHKYGRIAELKVLFPGAIISMDTLPHERGVRVLGSI